MSRWLKQDSWRKSNPLKRSIITAFAKARKRAAKRGVPFHIPKGTTKYLHDRCEGRCELSGLGFKTTETGICGPFSPSLDRIDPNKGYTLDNLRLILNGLNALKGDGTDEDLLQICKAVMEKNKL